MRLSLTCATFALTALAGAPANAESAFNRIATFPVAANLPADRDAGKATVAEIVAASPDGMLLIYTDSPQEAVGLVDIADPKTPKPAGFIPLQGEPTSVIMSGASAFVGVVTSPDNAHPSGQLATIDLASKAVTSSCDLGGQPD